MINTRLDIASRMSLYRMRAVKGGLLVVALVVNNFAYAGEAATTVGPIGGSDARAAVLPPPGLYGALGGIYVDMTGIYDKNGDEIYPDPVGSSKTLAYSLLYVYPFEVLGGSVASSISQSYGELCFGVSSSREKCSRGMGDIYSDLFFWSRNLTPESDPFGVTIGAGLGAVIPVGKYNVDEGKKGVPQRGGNIWDIVPNAAVTLSTKGVLGGDVTDISARLYYNHYLKNDATDYASGDLVHLSFAVSELYGKWRLGVAFDTFYQIEDDGSPDPRVAADISGSDGKRRYGFSSGPLVQKTFMLANRPWSVKAKVMLGQKAENNITINSTVLVLSTKI